MFGILSDLSVVRVLVLSGTGKQGLSIVQALAHNPRYEVSVLTRRAESPEVQAIAKQYGAHIIPGSYTTEEGLRGAFNNHHVAFVNLDSFSVGEPFEYFWTFRAYEIAVQSGLKWFIYAGAPNRVAYHGYAEEYRNSHNIVKARITEWLMSQPVHRLPWTVLTGGVYAEMLWTLLRPVREPDGSFTFYAPMTNESVIPLQPLEGYGRRFRWILEHSDDSVGHLLSAAPYRVTFPEIAQAFEEANAVSARFQKITVEQWMEAAKAFVDIEATLPRGSSKNDPTSFTFQRTFSAWWRLWRDGDEKDHEAAQLETSWAVKHFPDRAENIKEWMMRAGYTPEVLVKAPLTV